MDQTNLENIELFHIVHVDTLPFILESGETGQLICDSDVQKLHFRGAPIGMHKIKERRMHELTLASCPGLYVGDCVPFYFCPRSIMLYIFHQNNHTEIDYRGGQEPIVHLVFQMMEVIEWANQNGHRWAFTDSNAGSRYFTDYCELSHIDELDWDAIYANNWSNCSDKKQAEFLVEKSLPWHLVKKIAVYSSEYSGKVCNALAGAIHKPQIGVKREWYY